MIFSVNVVDAFSVVTSLTEAVTVYVFTVVLSGIVNMIENTLELSDVILSNLDGDIENQVLFMPVKVKLTFSTVEFPLFFTVRTFADEEPCVTFISLE